MNRVISNVMAERGMTAPHDETNADLDYDETGQVRPADDTRRAWLAAEVQRIVAKWAQPPSESLGMLPKPTKRGAQRGHCDVCGKWHGLPAVHLDYMGHADVTLALLDADPAWIYEPVTDSRGIPIIETHGQGTLVMWGHLTVNGVSRVCVGTCDAGKAEAHKELIGDALRNGAMRHGIGTRLWSKADGADPFATSYDDDAHEPSEDTTAATALFERLHGLKGTPAADAIREWAGVQGGSLSEPALRDPAWRAAVEEELNIHEQRPPSTEEEQTDSP